jgi:hypothetical protein
MEGLRQPRRRVSARENKRHTPSFDQSGHRQYALTPEVDIENGQIKFFARRDWRGRGNASGLRDHAVAELIEHLGDHHSDEDFVLDEENSKWLHGICFIGDRVQFPTTPAADSNDMCPGAKHGLCAIA